MKFIPTVTRHFLLAYARKGGATPALPNITLDPVASSFGVAITPINTSSYLGTGPYSMVPGYNQLPQGITLNILTGVIGGTPTDPRGWGWHEIRVKGSGSNYVSIKICSEPDINPANYDTVYNGTVINTATTLQNLTGQKLLLLNLDLNAALTLRNIKGAYTVIYNPDVDSTGDGVRLSYQGNVENLTIWGGNWNTALNGIIAEWAVGVTHPGLRVFNTRILDTGSAGGADNLHGMYIEAHDALIAGNVIGPGTDFPSAAGIRNGSGISVRSAARVRYNTISKCYNDGIGYYASADAYGGGLEICGNTISDTNTSNTGRTDINLLGIGGDAPIAQFIASAVVVDNGGANVLVDSAYATASIPVEQSDIESLNLVAPILAHRVYGPGYDNGYGPSVGDGTVKTHTTTAVNLSGTPIKTASVVLQGWTLRPTGTTDCSAPYIVTGTVEYPDGTPVGTIPATTVVPGGNIESAQAVLSTVIPTNATFRVRLSATPANGATYITKLGFAGLRNHARKSTMKKVVMAAFGDSIMTNNGGAVYNAASGRCPAYCASISSTTAGTYGASGAINFAKQVEVSSKLGVTHIVSNFATNDVANGSTINDLKSYLIAMRDRTRAYGMSFVQATMLPRTTQKAAVSATLTSTGSTITATVADSSLFEVGRPYDILGANESGYNGWTVCLSSTAGTVTFLGQPGLPAVATGTITIGPWKYTSSAGFMEPLSTDYAPGASSYRGLLNAWIRSGVFDSYLEWADACEPTRDSGRWAVGGELSLLPGAQQITVSSVINTSRFNSNYTRGSNTIANGFVQAITGANTGAVKSGNGNTDGDITVTSAWANAQVVGDTYYAIPGSSYISDDGTHPRVASGSTGGQALLDTVTAAWITAALA